MNLAKAQAHLQEYVPELMAIYLFGSQASGDAAAASDVDLAVLVRGQLDPLQLWELSGELADIVQRPVDLVTCVPLARYCNIRSSPKASSFGLAAKKRVFMSSLFLAKK